jgi:Putative MetA-pathway of phenol degradation
MLMGLVEHTALGAETLGGSAAETQRAKRGFSLFDPTPPALMRELSTDRPDKTESPYTVDAGHFQLELDWVSYSHDHDRSAGADTVTDNFSVVPINLKVGLLNQVDLQLVFDSYNQMRSRDRLNDVLDKKSGLGDLTSRLKINLWGNDGGRTAFALMPFLKVPTHQHHLGNSAVEGGVIFPLAVELPQGWSLGLMTEVDVLKNEVDDRYHTSFINSVTFGHTIVGRLAGYVEFFSEVSLEDDAPWVGTTDLGITFGLTSNIQLDAGINLGVTKSADDLNPFVGISWRW